MPEEEATRSLVAVVDSVGETCASRENDKWRLKQNPGGSVDMAKSAAKVAGVLA